MNRFFSTACKVTLAAAFFAFAPIFAFAADFTVTPLIVDLKANPRDILKETIGVINNATHVGNIYAFVNNTDPMLGMEEWKAPGQVDLADSLANWIEIKRGTLSLNPGGKVELPLLVQIDLHAKPGMYHATITFSEGGTRADAELNIKNGISVAVNVEVLDDAKEVLELDKFVSSGTYISAKEASFSYNLKNIGNRPVTPKGEVRIFNRSGEEVASLDVNKDGEVLDPSKSSQLASVWKSGSRFGRYKAMLNIDYGIKQPGSLQDTVFFWLIPWKEILAIFLCLTVVLLSFVMYWHNNYSLRKQRSLAYSIPHDFHPNAPAVQNQIYTPVSRPVSVVRPEPVQRPVVRETPPPQQSPAKVVAPGALRIQPKQSANVDLRNTQNFTVNLKK